MASSIFIDVQHHMFNIALHRFALFTAFSTFVLIFIGGLVTSTGSGLAVPDWPTTYGENMFTYPIDKWVGGIKYEHGHRLAASFVGFLTVILAIWLGMKEERRWVKWMGYYALLAVIIQGILGGLTVLFLLPTPVSMAHGMLAQTFFGITAVIALVTSQWWYTESKSIELSETKTLQMLSVAATAAVFIQLGFGALLRHTYSGLSIPDFPLTYGQFLPSLSSNDIEQYNQFLIQSGIKRQGDTPVAAYQIIIHFIHRTWAYVVAGIVGLLGYKLMKSSPLPSWCKKTGLVLIITIALQFTLGILTVLTRKEYIITSLHVMIGALVLVTTLLITVAMARLRWIKTNENR